MGVKADEISKICPDNKTIVVSYCKSATIIRCAPFGSAYNVSCLTGTRIIKVPVVKRPMRRPKVRHHKKGGLFDWIFRR